MGDLAQAMQNSRKVLLEGNQIESGLYPVLDLKQSTTTEVQVIPHTNDRGLTAIGVYRSSPPYVCQVYISYPWEAQPRLLVDLYATYGYIDLDPPFVNRDDNIFILTTDYTDPAHKLVKILKITPAGVVTEVYSYDCLGVAATGAYFWGMDSNNGYLWKGYRHSTGYHLVKSEDSGATWTVKRNVAAAFAVHSYEFAAYNDKVFVAITSTIDYSGDGGTTWSTLLTNGTSFEGVSLIGNAVYAPNYSFSSVFIWPDYTAQTKYFEVRLLPAVGLGQYLVNRQLKQIGNWIVGNGLRGDSSILWGSCDNFYTLSPLFRFSTGGKGSNERFSGFGETIFIGGTGYGDGMLWKGRLPQTALLKIPLARQILVDASLAASATSLIADSYIFDTRLAERFCLTVSVTYHATAGAGVKLHVLSSRDGYSFDDTDVQTETVTFAAGTSKQKTYSYDSCGIIKVQIENLDGAQAATSIQVWGQLMGVH